jgi:transposase
MSRHYISKAEAEEIKKSRQKNKDKTIDKWLEVLLLHAEGKKRATIAAKTGFKEQYITELVSEYRREGLEEYAKKQYRGNHRNMSLAEEEAILDSFKAKAQAGQIIEVSEIKAAYEAKLGRPAGSNSQIYNVLARHQWRKLMPRSKHPKKASEEEIEASKKLSVSSKRSWQILQIKMYG